jgi:uncharacterized protein (TIGR02611 family)
VRNERNKVFQSAYQSLKAKKDIKSLKIIEKMNIKQIKRLFVGIIGLTVLAIGLIMIVTPGPAFIVIPIGFVILATEFIWARRLLKKLKEKLKK